MKTNSKAYDRANVFMTLILTAMKIIVSWKELKNVTGIWAHSLTKIKLIMLIILVIPLTRKRKRKKVESITNKFRSWKSRTAFYKVRTKSHLNLQKKQGFNFNVSLNSAKHRYNFF